MNTQLNRAQRRAARRKPAPVRRVVTPKGLYILENARPHEPGEKAGAHIKTLTCFKRCSDGTGTEDDFDHVAMVLNMCKVRALDIDDSLADTIERAQEAMGRVKERYQRLKRFGFDGPAIAQVSEALNVCEAIIDASSPLQMRSARLKVVELILGKEARNRMVREGLL